MTTQLQHTAISKRQCHTDDDDNDDDDDAILFLVGSLCLSVKHSDRLENYLRDPQDGMHGQCLIWRN